jgi:hypothetical protein
MKVFIIRADICDYDGCSTTLVKAFKQEKLAESFCNFMNLSLQKVHKTINHLNDEYFEKIRSMPEKDTDPLSEQATIFYKKRVLISNEYGDLKKEAEDKFTSHFGTKFDKNLSYEYEEIELED